MQMINKVLLAVLLMTGCESAPRLEEDYLYKQDYDCATKADIQVIEEAVKYIPKKMRWEIASLSIDGLFYQCMKGKMYKYVK